MCSDLGRKCPAPRLRLAARATATVTESLLSRGICLSCSRPCLTPCVPLTAQRVIRAELILKSSRESQRPPLPPSSSRAGLPSSRRGLQSPARAGTLFTRPHLAPPPADIKGEPHENMVQLLTFHPENVDEENETYFQNREYLFCDIIFMTTKTLKHY